MVEILLAKIECKEIDTNHWLNGCQLASLPQTPTPFEFASRVEGTLANTSYSDGRHAKMTNKHLRSARVIMNMQNEIRPIR